VSVTIPPHFAAGIRHVPSVSIADVGVAGCEGYIIVLSHGEG